MYFFRKWLILMIFLLTARKNNSGTVIPWEKPRNDSASHGRLSSLQTNTPQYSHAFQSAEGQLALSIKGQSTKQKEKSSMGKMTQNPLYDLTVRFMLAFMHPPTNKQPRFSTGNDLKAYSPWTSIHSPGRYYQRCHRGKQPIVLTSRDAYDPQPWPRRHLDLSWQLSNWA